MKKVTLTKAQADALESAKQKYSKSNDDFSYIIKIHVVDSKWILNEHAELNELDLHTLCKALYQGYEIEKSPEDKIKELYQYYMYEATRYSKMLYLGGNYTNNLEHEFMAKAALIKNILDILNIKIKGVNE